MSDEMWSAGSLFGGMTVIDARSGVKAGPAGTVFDLMGAWQDAYVVWMDALRSDNTRRAYAAAWNALLGFCGRMPWEITTTDVHRWVAAMQGAGLSGPTRNQRVAGVSSFYQFVIRDYRVTRPDGSEAVLRNDNPAVSKLVRARINPYGKARYLAPAECRALLGAIKRSSVQGLRDYALFLGYLYTGRRNTEWRTVRWGQFEESGKRVFYTWSGKGKTDQRFELAVTVWDAVREFLRAAGRLEGMGDNDFVFTGLSGSAKRLPRNQFRGFDETQEPLSMRQVGALLKKYARRAGLKVENLHVHVLRHSAAMLRHEVGDDVESIQRFLCHSSLAVTQIYLHTVEGQVDSSWAKIDLLLQI